MAIARALLTIDVSASDDVPTEIRLLSAGLNQSENGDFVFDDVAARTVMAAWEQHTRGLTRAGMIDLEHLSLDASAASFDPDARAWFDFELRDGDLWMTHIAWTADGAARLREKRQRFLSPAILYDTSTRRVRSIVNVALTALPALHGAPELIAARVAQGRHTMAEDSGAAMAQILKAMGLDAKMPSKVAVALGLDAGASLDDIRAALDAFAAKMAKVEELLSDADPADAAADEAPADAAAAEADAAPAASPDAAASMRFDIAALRAELAEHRAFRASVEEKERHDLVASMVARGAEMPATAWTDDSARVPAEPWASMSLASLRARVATLAARAPAPVAPAQGSALTEQQLAICKEYGLDPARFAALRAKELTNG